jgi:hypothetical protein
MATHDPVVDPLHAALHGYIGATLTPPPQHEFGVSFYVTVWALLEKSIKEFQVGLPSAWIHPRNSDFEHLLCPVGTVARDLADKGDPDWVKQAETYFRDVFQTIEGGLGFWGSTLFAMKAPKYRINGIPDCYTHAIGSPGWPFGKTTVLDDDNLGLAQLSNRFIIPPDGMTFADGSDNMQLGLAWMALPLLDYYGYFLLQTKRSIDEKKCLQVTSSGGALLSFDENAEPTDGSLWIPVPSEQRGYFWLFSRGINVPVDFGGGPLWKLVPAGDDYYYLQTAKDNNKVLGGTDAVGMGSRSKKDADAQLWKLQPKAFLDYLTDPPSQDVAVGDSSWTFFVNAENFKGPVAFFPPTTWSRIAKRNTVAAGRGLDARPALLGDTSMEINTVPGYHVLYQNAHYMKIPQLLFSTEQRKIKGVSELVTPLMQDITLYSREAIYAPMMAAFAKGSAPKIEFQKKGAVANIFKEGFPMDLDAPNFFTDKRSVLRGISDLVEVTYLGDGKSCSWGLLWKRPPAGSGFTIGQFPQYFENGVAVPTVPDETTLTRQEFDPPDSPEEDYKSPAAEPRDKWTKDSAWTFPGPTGDIQKGIVLADGTEIWVGWYKFVDQPTLKNTRFLTPEQRNELQARVELLHKQWNITSKFIDPPKNGKLVSVDPNLIVTPPQGLEVGYVPIVVKQVRPNTPPSPPS